MITIRNLCKSYGSLKVLKNLSLDIYNGETLVILGRSGVGKSVLLKQIIGIETPDSGFVEIDGKRIDTLSQKDRYSVMKGMGMLFQGAALFDSMNVAENTAFYLRQHQQRLNEAEISEQVKQALSMVGLEEVETKMPSELSGGMRKRAALARLIVYHPRILLYDEPTTGLDPITAGTINDLISMTQKKLKATSIVVTHDIRSAVAVGDRLAFHHDGKILYTAPKHEFLKSNIPEIKAFFENAILTADMLERSIK